MHAPWLPLEARWFDPSSWGAPFPVVVAALYAIVLLRAGGTYALGRGIAAGAQHTRLARLRRSPGLVRARSLVERWGAPVVAGSFLTIGLQTLVNLSAGILRMPLRHYLPALALGGLAWALVYATAGLVSWNALTHLHERSPAAAWAVGTLAVVGAVGFVAVRARRRVAEDEEAAP